MTKPAVAPEVLTAPREDRPEARVRARRLWRRRAGHALWVAFLVLDVPLLMAVVGGLAAAYLDPRPFWWAQLLGVTLPYLTVPLLLATAGPLLARRWGWFALHLALLGAVAWRMLPEERFGEPPPPAAGDLVLMTFNVPQSGPSGDALSDSLVALLERRQPDVLALQDVWAHGGSRRPLRGAVHVQAVVERLPYVLGAPPRYSPEDPQRPRSITVPILVREGGGLDVLDQQAVSLDVPPLAGDDDNAVSMSIRTHFRWQGREGVLYNLHLRSFGPAKPWEDRIRLFEPGTWLPYLRHYRAVFRARADEVDRLAAQIDAEVLPVLIVGDFNETSNTWAYRRLRRGRQDAFLAAGLGTGNTYRADKPLVRIDYVLADSAWAVTAAEVPVVGFSDHRPLVVRLRWRSEERPGA